MSTFPIIGIGLSAGGLEPLEAILRSLPESPGVAFVILQHLDPTHPSQLPEILNRHTELPLTMAHEDQVLQPDHLYLIPAGHYATLGDKGTYLRTEALAGRPSFPIDQFFRSLGLACGGRGAAVILSGSGSDGSRGIQMVKGHNGLVLVQAPSTCQFPSMPQSALDTGLPPREIYPALASYFFPTSDSATYQPLKDLIEPVLPDLLTLIREQTQLDFQGYKTPTLLRRIEKHMRLQNVLDVKAYQLMLPQQPERIDELVQDFLIGVTDFFRDRPAFHYLREQFLPTFLAEAEADQELRIWVCGCSTGQEAYSLAMCLHACFEAQQRFLPLRIIASDVSEAALTRASQARYLPAEVQSLPERLRMRYMVYDGTHYEVVPEIRDLLIFTRNDVLSDPPFINLDLLVCRNLLIYLQPAYQQQVLGNFHYALRSGSYLWLGPSESLGALDGAFEEIEDRHNFYRAISTSPKPMPRFARRFAPTTPPTCFAPPQLGASSVHSRRREESSYASLRTELRLAHDLLEHFAPDAVLISANYDLLYQTGQVSRYLSLPRLRMSQNLLNMVPQNLAARLSEALSRLRKHQQPIDLKQVNVAPEEEPPQACDVLLRRFETSDRRSGEPECFLIEFRAQSVSADPEEAAPVVMVPQNEQEELYQTIYHLQAEVYDTQAELQSTIEHLEASHEELQSTNEELLAANEELQSTNEELHSVNEELHSVNAEVQEANQQLREVNNDLDNLIDSTDAALLFLDAKLHIRRFSEQARTIFAIEARDEGRFLGDLVHNLEDLNLVQTAYEVIEQGEAFVRTVNNQQGEAIRVAMRPYREPEKKEVFGVVMTFVSITEQIAELRKELSRSEERFRALVDGANDYITIVDPAGRILYCNWASEQLPMAQLLNRSLAEIVPEAARPQMLAALDQVLRGGPIGHFTSCSPLPSGDEMWHDNQLTPIYDKSGAIDRVLIIGRDITERIMLERKLEDQRRQFSTFMHSSPIIAWIKDVSFRYTYLNPAFCTAINADPTYWLGRNDYELQAQEVASQLRRNDEEVLRRRETIITIEQVPQPDGRFAYSQTVKFPIFEGEAITHIGGFALDITGLKQREEEVDRMRRELEGIVVRRTQELEQANRELRTFNHTVAHDLRAPIRAVYSFAALMEEECGAQLPEAARAYLDKINDRAQKMGKLVDDLLTFSRLGNVPLRTQPLDMQAMIQRVVGTFEEEGLTARARVLIPPLLPAMGDPDLMEQALTNLIGNAFKYSARRPKPIVEFGCRAEEEEVIYYVEDNGVGFAPQYETKIFEIFERLRKESEFPGTGIGLAIVKKAMQLQGGRVWAEGRPERGATFFWALPAADAT